MKWQAMRRDEAQKILADGIGCKVGGEGLRIAAIAECLRTASYLCSAPISGSGAWESAASLSLTSMVRRRLTPIWPNLTDEDDAHPGVMTVLKSLGELGDLVQLVGGRWLTPPAHAVRASDGTAVLIGGGPAQTFPRHVQIRGSGRVRLVDAGSCDGWVDTWEPHEWIGAPMEGLQAWSTQLLATMKAKFTDAPSDLSEVSICASGRWIDVAGTSTAEGIFLSRCRTGPRYEYFIGDFFRGRLRKIATLGSQHAKRLRFYLDAQAGKPMRVKAVISQGHVKLRLYRQLPREEAKALLLGWQLQTPEGEHPGVTYHVLPIEVLPIVRSALDGLGVVVDERQDAEGGN